MATMIITVGSDIDFHWRDRASDRLWGPNTDIVCPMRLVRDNEVFDLCEIRRVSGWSMFLGLQKVFGTPYNHNLVAYRFEPGDRLEISLPDDEMDETTYWMMLR